MKRNRLLNSSPKARLFTSEKTPHSKRRHLLALSMLSMVGVFLTTIVLATSTPVSTETKSQLLNLPNQNAQQQEQSKAVTEKQPLTLSLAEPASLPEVNAPAVQRVPVPNQIEAKIAEPDEIERIHLKQDSLDVTTETDITVTPAATAVTEDINLNWQEVTVKGGDNLSLIFPRVGLSARDVYNVAQTEDIKPLLNLKPDQTLRFGLRETEDKTQLQQLELQLSPVEKLQLTLTESGYQAQTETRETDKRQKQVAGQIESSLFEAGLMSGMSDKLIMELAHIFGWDIDFALDLRQGDNFKVIFEESYLDGEKFDDGDILAAEFTNRGTTFRAVRYTDAEGNSHFYAPTGDSMRKTFTRTPVHFSRISSRFNPNRKHPVLKTSRPHRGVDYAAATGTPILATGDGKVDFIGTKGGYGRTVILSHGGKYTTLYAHMSRFKKGMRSGQRVKQGQTIGYIGSSGLATGPHLHYEFRVNGVHHNPLTVALPKAKPLNAKYMADFQQKSQPLLAQLDALQLPALALNQP
ncbi:peptidoglycan DD-metalloendopeptidase family protein [Methylophaga thiooxydans]|nr:peptidoglycan DD-metalloendopeptidase family protein [Methylophaga thiooxydans]